MKDSRISVLICLSLITLTLTSCAPYRPASGKAAYCNQLNSQMIFGGNIHDTRNLNQQSADAPLVARTFDNDDCA